MKTNDKWLLFKNYLHNELQITREDIRTWIEDAIKVEAKLLTDKTFNDFDINKFITNLLLDHNYFDTRFKAILMDKIATQIVKKKLDITIKD